MVTPDEIGMITVVESLEPADRERLCRVAADLSIGVGSFAMQGGDGPALFGLHMLKPGKKTKADTAG